MEDSASSYSGTQAFHKAQRPFVSRRRSAQRMEPTCTVGDADEIIYESSMAIELQYEGIERRLMDILYFRSVKRSLRKNAVDLFAVERHPQGSLVVLPSSAMAMFVFFPRAAGTRIIATDLLSLAHDRDRGGSCCGGDRRLFGCCALSSEKELTDWWLVCAISILEGTRV